jgi:NDP-sugar pyrophosphorylase family protein
MRAPSTAFLLGAGLGTRLRPLTADCPKPLLPVAGRPMITHTLDRLLSAGIRRFILNTHHAAGRYQEVFPDGTYRGVPITLVHEPLLLDTGGGLKNIEALLDPNEPLLVHNGDIYTTLPLDHLIHAHAASAPATLALRTSGPSLNVTLAPDGTITDFRGTLGQPGTPYQFTGIYLIEPRLLHLIPASHPVSIIDTFLELIRRGDPPRGVIIDDGIWHDLGTLEEYQRIQHLHAPSSP